MPVSIASKKNLNSSHYAMDETPSTSPSTSPRISFSHHISHKDENNPYTESNSDSDFCNVEAETETSSADEIFSNGFLLPLHDVQQTRKDDEQILKEDVKSQSRPFWRIRRSSSLHCKNSQRRGAIWSFHSLPRSTSTGSKQTKKEIIDYHKLKNGSSSSSVHFYEFRLSSQKHGNGAVRINPVLNVPPPSCMSMGNTNLFGLGSLFKSGKDKKSTKK